MIGRWCGAIGFGVAVNCTERAVGRFSKGALVVKVFLEFIIRDILTVTAHF
jgi:hypothetical protein